ncbi:MAG: hypothetical protein HUU21_03470 [Polyangiaceae bacterium]|nr:hypothetical protein [Polyangiaceae bacterium]NUQ72591.1 hypothetical protein [Polyangiaceae bacterium]
MTQALHLNLCIPPDWKRIELVRKAVGFCVWAAFGRGDLRDSVAMVSAELLENAVKYSTPSSEVAISIWEESDRVVVAVTNTVAEESPHIASLKRRLDWAHGFPSPAEAYMAALSEVFDQNGGVPSGQGGLGLVRIAYEGGCSIDCDSATDGKVTVRAFRAIAGDAAPTSGTG